MKKNTMENMTKEQAAIKWLLDTLRPFENMEALGPLECFKIREIESLIKKLTASGSVAAPKEEENFYSRVTEIRGWLLHQKMEIDGRYVVRLADALHAVSQLKPLESENTALREALKELLPIAQWGYDLLVPFDKKGMGREWPAIIERARNLLNP